MWGNMEGNQDYTDLGGKGTRRDGIKIIPSTVAGKGLAKEKSRTLHNMSLRNNH